MVPPFLVLYTYIYISMADTHETINLVQGLKDGDEASLSIIYDKYSPALYGLILKIVKDDALAQDILQECFLKIWKKAKSYNSEKGSFFTWMLNTCRNASIDSLRKSERILNGKNQIEDSGVYKVNGLDTNIETIGVQDVIKNLSKEQQIIIDYIYFRGYTQQEISDELEIPLGTVKTRSRMALKELKNYFTIALVLWILKNI